MFCVEDCDLVYCVMFQLSPALRNRFVEIWCSSVSSRDSFGRIIKHNLDSTLTGLSEYLITSLTVCNLPKIYRCSMD